LHRIIVRERAAPASRRSKIEKEKVCLLDFSREDLFDFQNWFRKPAGEPLGKGGSVEKISLCLFDWDPFPEMGPYWIGNWQFG
jgi:hypothetical protein